MGMEIGISLDNCGWHWLAVLTICGCAACVGTVGSDGAKIHPSQSGELVTRVRHFLKQDYNNLCRL